MRLEVPQPILDFDDMARLREIEQHTDGKFKSYELDITYPLAWGDEGVEAKLASLCAESGGRDQERPQHPDHQRPPRWTATTSRSRRCWRCRRSTSTWCARACARRPAWWSRPARRARCITSRVLAGYGAEAVHPYLAMETLARMHKELPGDLSAEKAIYNYVKAIGKGLSKIMSKMGVSTYMSLLRRAAVRGDRPRQGAGRQVLPRHRQPGRRHRRVRGRRRSACACTSAAFGDDPVLAGMLDAGGEYAWRVRGEEHMWTPDAIAKLQHSTRANKFDTYKEYAQIINDQSRRHMTLRGLFEFKLDPSKAIPLDEVEPADGDRQALRHRRDVARLDLDRSARHAGRRDEPHRRQEQHRRRRRRPGALPQRAEGHPDHRRAPRSATCVGAQGHRGRLRAEGRRLAALARSSRSRRAASASPTEYLVIGRPDPDQDGAGRQARRRRPAARRQGDRVHRHAALLGAGRRPDLAAAAPRHLFDRRPGAADPRPEERQPARRASASSWCQRSRRRHHRRRRGQGQGRPRRDRRPRRRHRRVAVVARSSMPARRGNWAWPRRSRRWC